MKYTIKITGSVLVMVLIMTLSAAQSMEMRTFHELAESGIIINFAKKPQSSYTPPTRAVAPDRPQTVARPPQARIRFQLAESGQTIVFPLKDEPANSATDPIRTIVEPDREAPAPLADTPYHTRHTFEMAESGQTIVFHDKITASPGAVERSVTLADDTRAQPTTPGRPMNSTSAGTPQLP